MASLVGTVVSPDKFCATFRDVCGPAPQCGVDFDFMPIDYYDGDFRNSYVDYKYYKNPDGSRDCRNCKWRCGGGWPGGGWR